MKVHRILLSVLVVLLSGCLGRGDLPERDEAVSVRIPRWSFLASAKGQLESGRHEVPKAVYVFPALRLDDEGKPMDQLLHREGASGDLKWVSTAPAGHEIKMILEKKLREKGFTPYPFSTLAEAEEDHSILVVNPYYKEAGPSPYNPEGLDEASWSNLIRIEAITFAGNLNPNTKRGVFALELLSLFNDQQLDHDVVKRATSYLLDHIGRTGNWSERVNLLN